MKATMNLPMITPNAHERSEWMRMADALDAVDNYTDAAKFRVAASNDGCLSSMTVTRFDALQSQYRAWLVFGTL